MLRHLGFVIFPDFQLLDATGPAGVFDVANRMAGEEVYKITMLSERGGLVTSSCGVGVDSQPLSACRQADTVLVVGGLGTAAAAKNSAIKKYVNEMAEQAQRLCSVCTGTFVLAAAGVLSGRKATTHWRQTAYLLRNYPEVCVQEDKIWVRDGKFWSSAGVTAGIDLALALVKEDLGEDVAKNTAREIVVYYQRPGAIHHNQHRPGRPVAEPGAQQATRYRQ